MFEAVRSKLGSAWKGLRARGLPSLFLFELVVVTLGVLIAQGLADWAGRRGDIEKMEQARLRTNEDIAIFGGSARAWQRAIPCFDKRMDEILQQIDAKGEIDPGLGDRPGFASVLIDGLSTEQVDLLREEAGEAVANRYQDAAYHSRSLDARMNELLDAWQGVALVDPANGRVSDDDRFEAKRAAVRIKTLLRGVDISAGWVVEASNQLGIRPSADITRTFFTDCNDLWAKKNMFVPDAMEAD